MFLSKELGASSNRSECFFVAGILAMYEEILLNMDFIHLAQFLTRLPDSMSAHRLFRHIEAINMNIDKRRFGQVLALHKEIYTQKEQDKNDTWWKHVRDTVWFR